MTGDQVREGFLDFFRQRGHTVVPSAPLVPENDPSLLFTNAGMVPFKQIFLGNEARPYRRAVNSQKCLRISGKHNDLEQVGRDTYHHTFFEMLGNWSFGDYYKREAIGWAWELLTKVWKLPKDELYATVYTTDDEAAALWAELTDVGRDRILRFEAENFWEMGETGPCGPCSEIHIDRGPAACDRRADKTHRCAVNGGCARYIELWNLVFIQQNRDEKGKLSDLPARHVDTGMGFERICTVLQGVSDNYAVDVLRTVVAAGERLSGKRYGAAERDDVSASCPRTRAAATCSAGCSGARRGTGSSSASTGPSCTRWWARWCRRWDAPTRRSSSSTAASPRSCGARRSASRRPSTAASRCSRARSRGRGPRRRACSPARLPSASTTPTASRST